MKIATSLLLFCSCTTVFAFVAPVQSNSGTTTTSLLWDGKDVSALTESVKTIFTTEDIDRILPHRYPFALVDKVVEYEAGKSAVGIKCVTKVCFPVMQYKLCDIDACLRFWNHYIKNCYLAYRVSSRR